MPGVRSTSMCYTARVGSRPMGFRCPIAVKQATLRPYLRDLSVVVDAAGHSWCGPLQTVLASSNRERAYYRAAQCLSPRGLSTEIVDERPNCSAKC
eukprot:COSAG02_NODE_644_length_18993_cov_6.626389_6_plen_96_part_00